MKRRAKNLAPWLEQRLSGYALAASAAGVGVLALAQPAEAKIVYTPAHVVVHRGWPGTTFIDLNHDGTADFEFENWWLSNTESGSEGILSVFSAQKSQRNGIAGYGTAGKGTLVYFASALRAGARIGPKKSFFYPKVMDWMFRASAGWGQWNDVSNRYLGFKFRIKGKTHYGWARLNVHFNPNNYKINAVLTGYAYESIPNRPIIAGKTKGPDVTAVEPFSLGHLARGASGIPAWRQKSVGATN